MANSTNAAATSELLNAISAHGAKIGSPTGSVGEASFYYTLENVDAERSDALEAVRRLRPRFLMSRGTVSIRDRTAGSVHASIDWGPLMTVDYLKRIRVSEISEIRYLNSRDAAQRFGTSSETGGVIVVTIRR